MEDSQPSPCSEQSHGSPGWKNGCPDRSHAVSGLLSVEGCKAAFDWLGHFLATNLLFRTSRQKCCGHRGREARPKLFLKLICKGKNTLLYGYMWFSFIWHKSVHNGMSLDRSIIWEKAFLLQIPVWGLSFRLGKCFLLKRGHKIQVERLCRRLWGFLETRLGTYIGKYSTIPQTLSWLLDVCLDSNCLFLLTKINSPETSLWNKLTLENIYLTQPTRLNRPHNLKCFHVRWK